MSNNHWIANKSPREKLVSNGINQLSDTELLAIILKTGTKEKSVLDYCDDLLNQYDGLSGLYDLSLEQLTKIKGIGLAKACELIATFEIVKRISYQQLKQEDVINKPQLLIDWIKKEIGWKDQEYFLVVYLNVKNKIIGHEIMFVGKVNEVDADSRIVFSKALKKGAVKIIVAHNHPSSFSSPSIADDITTNQLSEAGRIINLPLIDHIIVGKNDYFSYKENGIL